MAEARVEYSFADGGKGVREFDDVDDDEQVFLHRAVGALEVRELRRLVSLRVFTRARRPWLTNFPHGVYYFNQHLCAADRKCPTR